MPQHPILYRVAWRDARDENGTVAHGVKSFKQYRYESRERFLCRMGEFARLFHKARAWSAIIDAQSYRILIEYGTRFADLPPMPLPLKPVCATRMPRKLRR